MFSIVVVTHYTNSETGVYSSASKEQREDREYPKEDVQVWTGR
jgi:hypothetical protein